MLVIALMYWIVYGLEETGVLLTAFAIDSIADTVSSIFLGNQYEWNKYRKVIMVT